MRKKLIHALGMAACVALLAYLATRGVSLWDAVSDRLHERQPWVAVASTSLLSLAAYVPLSLGWLHLLPIKHTGRNFLGSFAIVLLSQAARYLPGNVGHLIGKVLITRNWLSLPASQATMLAVLELLLCVLCSVAISMLGLSYLLQAVSLPAWIPINPAWILLGGLTAASLLLLIPSVRRRLNAIPFPAFRDCLAATMSYGINAILGGLAVWLLVAGVSPGNGMGMGYAILAYAIAWLAGFLTPGAPAGLGVREFVFTLILGPTIGESDALLVAGLLRLATLAGDAVAFLLGAWLKMQGYPRAPERLPPAHGLSS